MRLVCPNCGAQYEVPDDVIPEGGRDVQCSNCGDTWFQKHPSQDRELAEELEQPLDEAHWDTEPDDSAAEPEPEPEPEEPEWDEPEPEPEPETAGDWDGFGAEEPAGETPEPEPEPQSEEPEDSQPDDEEPQGEPQPRPLDPGVRDVLREEAEQELQARAAERESLETQTELGLEDPGDEASRREREARLRMARMRGLPDEEAEDPSLAEHASRRDLLPDIDEINSTLRKDSDRATAASGAGADAAGEAAATGAAGSRGFSSGFRSIVLLAVLALLVYVFAGQIGDMVPALKAPLDSYVALINSGRAWLDTQVLKLTGYLDSLTSE